MDPTDRNNEPLTVRQYFCGFEEQRTSRALDYMLVANDTGRMLPREDGRM